MRHSQSLQEGSRPHAHYVNDGDSRTSAKTHEGEGADPREGTFRDLPREGPVQDPKACMETVVMTL